MTCLLWIFPRSLGLTFPLFLRVYPLSSIFSVFSFACFSFWDSMSWRGATEFLWYRVVAQIAAVQIGFWFILGLTLVLLDLTVSIPISDVLKQMFDWKCCFRFDSVRGYVTMVSQLKVLFLFLLARFIYFCFLDCVCDHCCELLWCSLDCSWSGEKMSGLLFHNVSLSRHCCVCYFGLASICRMVGAEHCGCGGQHRVLRIVVFAKGNERDSSVIWFFLYCVRKTSCQWNVFDG